MKVFIEGQLTNIFKNKDFEDKNTGSVTAGKYQLQFLTKRDMGDGLGEQMILEKVSIPDALIGDYRGKEGEIVTVPVNVMATKDRRVIFYGVTA